MVLIAMRTPLPRTLLYLVLSVCGVTFPTHSNSQQHIAASLSTSQHLTASLSISQHLAAPHSASKHLTVPDSASQHLSSPQNLTASHRSTPLWLEQGGMHDRTPSHTASYTVSKKLLLANYSCEVVCEPSHSIPYSMAHTAWPTQHLTLHFTLQPTHFPQIGR